MSDAITRHLDGQTTPGKSLIVHELGQNYLTGACVTSRAKLAPTETLYLVKAPKHDKDVGHLPRKLRRQVLPCFVKDGQNRYHVSCNCSLNATVGVYSRVSNISVNRNPLLVEATRVYALNKLRRIVERVGRVPMSTLTEIAIGFLENAKNITRKDKDRRIKNIHSLTDCGALGITSLLNHSNAFVKNEVLIAETHIPRIISAREELIRDLTEAVNHYV